jgi:hypothetical protein
VISVCAVALIASLRSAAFAQPADKRTFFTFSGPVTMPGVTLPTGKYLFRIADATSSSHIIQVLNEDGTRIYGTFFSIAAERPVVAEKPEVRFMETASSTPPAIRTWWYPGQRRGYEFIYPKTQARLLAKTAGPSVLTTQAQSTTTAQTESKTLTRMSSTGQETNVDGNAQPASATPTGKTQEGEVAPPTLVLPSNPVPVKPTTE